MRVLVLGSTGMLGSAVCRAFSAGPGFSVFAAARTLDRMVALKRLESARFVVGVSVEDLSSVETAMKEAKPDLVINCIGVIKQLAAAADPVASIYINSLFPHQLHRICRAHEARLIHVSTDCVFTGKKGSYLESDFPDADDLYGRSKLLGEIVGEGAITLRTSIIGEEINNGSNGLVGWFLSQTGDVKGFRKAIFSGFPTVSLARIIRDYIVPRPDMNGLYHVSAEPIDKYSLLQLVKAAYERDTLIAPDDRLEIDRSLNSDRFREKTGFVTPDWPALVDEMRSASSFWNQ
jgi:dTDP-4-dehydrorhamnose reductase